MLSLPTDCGEKYATADGVCNLLGRMHVFNITVSNIELVFKCLKIQNCQTTILRAFPRNHMTSDNS
jgi:hypothetical protein